MRRQPPFPPNIQRGFPPQQSFYPTRQMMNPQGMSRGPGGLLSRIFGGGRAVPPVQQMMNPGTSTSMLSNLQNLANPSSISSMMGNIQRVLKVAESMGPMVQQYGPLVRNLPSLIKVYQALRTSDDSEETVLEAETVDVTEDANETEQDTTPVGIVSTLPMDNTDATFEEEFTVQPSKGSSTPKLYI
ncbi:YqfQ family protein [Bacillus sp. CGMCC 1.16541]|uniref:YqfQ family protein n=1 Tax=Bacillus sp. CGMCC 1.16541 TaxID=2185143 RepID=UPI001EF54335|nr:YqfQ family protein [Bacillus sp. CGMCC 1.16541]